MFKKVAPYLLIPLLFRVPVGYNFGLYEGGWNCPEKRLGMALSFIMVVFFCICVWVWKYNKPLSLMFGLCFFNICYPSYVGLGPIIFVLFGAIWYLFWVELKPDFNIFCNAVCILCLIHVSLLVSQSYGFDPIFNLSSEKYETKVVGFFTNINFASAFIAVCLPAFLRKWWFLFLPALGYGLVLTQTTSSIIGLCVAFFIAGFYLPIYWRTKVAVGVLMILVLVGYSFVDRPNFDRLKDWKIFVKLDRNKRFIDGPLFLGSGLGSFKSANVLKDGKLIRENGKLLYVNGDQYTHMHNDFLEKFVELGWLTIPIYLGFFYHVLRRMKNNIISGIALIVSFVVAFCSYPIHNGTVATIIVAWMAMFDRRGLKENIG